MVGNGQQGEEAVIYNAYFKIICAMGVERRDKYMSGPLSASVRSIISSPVAGWLALCPFESMVDLNHEYYFLLKQYYSPNGLKH